MSRAQRTAEKIRSHFNSVDAVYVDGCGMVRPGDISYGLTSLTVDGDVLKMDFDYISIHVVDPDPSSVAFETITSGYARIFIHDYKNLIWDGKNQGPPKATERKDRGLQMNGSK